MAKGGATRPYIETYNRYSEVADKKRKKMS